VSRAFASSPDYKPCRLCSASSCLCSVTLLRSTAKSASWTWVVARALTGRPFDWGRLCVTCTCCPAFELRITLFLIRACSVIGGKTLNTDCNSDLVKRWEKAHDAQTHPPLLAARGEWVGAAQLHPSCQEAAACRSKGRCRIIASRYLLAFMYTLVSIPITYIHFTAKYFIKCLNLIPPYRQGAYLFFRGLHFLAGTADCYQ